MILKVVKRSKNELILEISGDGHSFFNALHSVLLKDNDVELAGYSVPHPLEPKTVFYIRTGGDTDPREALLKGTKILIEELKEAEKAFIEAWENEGRKAAKGSKG
jgi:DNA-directed RNA polymerase subunit L